MKLTMSKIKKMTMSELIAACDKVEGVKTISTRVSRREIEQRFIGYYNKGLIK